jgi:ABC-type multidrug transport system fused ATPase/permease subunit
MFRLYHQALRGFRRKSALAVALFALSGFAESLGIASLLPFLQGSLAKGEQHEYLGLRGDDLAGVALGALIVLGVVGASLKYTADVLVYRIQGGLEASLRSRMSRALFDMRWSAFATRSFGDTVKSLLTDGQAIGAGVSGMVSGLGYVTIAAVFVVIAAVISLEMTGATLVFGALVVLGYRVAGRRAQARSSKLSAQATVVTDLIEELFNNFKFYRSSGLRRRALDRADTVYREWGHDFVRVWSYQPATRLGFDVAGLAFITAVLAIAVLVVGNSAAEAFVFLALFYRLAPRLQLAQQGLLIARAQSVWWTMWKERYDAAIAAAEAPRGSIKLSGSPTVEARDVTYSYPGRDTPAVASVSWTLPQGECLAIVGDSGSGKTTMLDLVSGLLNPDTGTVRLDDADLRQVDVDAWQHRIGVVMQDAPVFFGTVLDNIAWGFDEPDRERAAQCVEQANFSDVVADLPEGLDTPVGHKGSLLSGGQRQRLALARALYREPWLLVLDEATSALDSESEQAIQRALRALKGTCSILLVAHRLKTVEMADRIVVLDDGRVAEAGTWSELADRDGGAFKRMLAMQGTSQHARDESAR